MMRDNAMSWHYCDCGHKIRDAELHDSHVLNAFGYLTNLPTEIKATFKEEEKDMVELILEKNHMNDTSRIYVKQTSADGNVMMLAGSGEWHEYIKGNPLILLDTVTTTDIKIRIFETHREVQ